MMSIHRLSRVFVLSLVLSVVIGGFMRPVPAMLRAGDYPGFYGIAVLAKDSPSELYSRAAQIRVQEQAWPDREGFFYTVYPPYTAVLSTPLAELPLMAGKIVFTVIMLVGFLLGGWVLFSGLRSRADMTGFLLALCSAPAFTSLVAAQNTGLSFLLGSLFLVLAQKQDKRSQLLLGAVVAVWTFKPQYALFLFAFLVGRGSWLAFVGALPILAANFLLGVSVLGMNWPATWFAAASSFGPENFLMNGHQMASVISLFGWIFSPDVAAEFQTFAVILGLVASLGLGFLGRSRPEAAAATMLAALPLISPQTLFYDIALALPAALYVLRSGRMQLSHLFWWSSATYVAFFMRAPSSFPLFVLLALLLFGGVLDGILFRSSGFRSRQAPVR